MEHTEQINELAAALAKAQGAMTNVIAAQTARVATRAGGEYSYNYADLAAILQAIRKPLSDNGLCILQGIHAGDGSIIIMTALIHTSGQWVKSELALPLPEGATPQNIGSVITYGRRYGLTALIGIAQEDDDAKSASEKPPQAPRPQPPRSAREVPAVKLIDEQTQRLSSLAAQMWEDAGKRSMACQAWLKDSFGKYWENMSPPEREDALNMLADEVREKPADVE